ncbi:unnamed protein product, partial [Mesorhabditis belari]|uniref:BPTI/Kunitz inhibitor domain-containing protein n=1 Tax=Mesorhabditis belari TaxID=2138241 RepID=A0AAF3EMN8_9BILA
MLTYLLLLGFVAEVAKGVTEFDDLDDALFTVPWDSRNGHQRYNVYVQPPPDEDQGEKGRLTLSRRKQNYDFSLLCADGVPLLLEDDKPKKCDPKPYKPSLRCPIGFWCHNGFSEETQYCCPRNKKIRNRCHLQPVIGHGKAEMVRFYYDWKHARCMQMIYTGVGGNENNFITYAKCTESCKGSGEPPQGESVYRPLNSGRNGENEALSTSPTSVSTTTTVVLTNPITISKTTTNAVTTKTVPTTRTSEPTKPSIDLEIEEENGEGDNEDEKFIGNPCSLPRERGEENGGQPLNRYYFDSSVQNCVQFTYYGIGGNANRFESFDECSITCAAGKSIKTSCNLSISSGNGRFEIPRWAFDEKTKKCVRFNYSGQNGNDNRFLTRRKCERICLRNPRKNGKTTTIVAGVPLNLGERTTTPFSRLNKGKTRPPQQTLFPLPPPQQPISVQPPAPHQPLPSTYINPKPIEKKIELNKTLPPNIPIAVFPSPGMLPVTQPTSAHTSPCRQPLPLQPVIMCHTGTPCPITTFCQIGEGHSICCPIIDAEPCQQLPEPGTGNAQIGRWAFDPSTQQCSPFVFRGFQGNQNNFRTFVDCASTCGGRSPCTRGEPAFPLIAGERCSATNNCPRNFVCSADPFSLEPVCCPEAPTSIEEFTFSKGPRTGYTPPIPQEAGPITVPTPPPTLLPSSLFTVDPCALPGDPGYGTTMSLRFFYDSETASCQTFQYNGNGGNDNNFVSLADCRRVCPEYRNPCPSGSPLLDSTSNALFCGVYGGHCPVGGWCHHGSDRATTVCCSEAFDPCALPLSAGTGREQLSRFYYNEEARQCEQFVYSGSGGNQNNFLSKADCESSCPVVENPCSVGLPAFDVDGVPMTCSTSDSSCPSGFFCHIGATSVTTVCCHRVGDPCTLQMARGNGAHVLNRWYYDRDTKLCASFVYSGKSGNENNFLSKADCQSQCPEFQSPCSAGLPHIDLSGQFTRCSATNTTCPTTYWCHLGVSAESTVCCPGAADPCEQPLSVGNGQFAVNRFTFDHVTRTCRQFYYSGSGGNENNFARKEACEKRCPVFANPCAIGEPQSDENFSPIHCTAEDESMCSEGYFCHLGAHEHTTVCCPGRADDPCAQGKSEGKGDESIQRYFFSSETRQCLAFTFKGLAGNQNNFRNKIDCELRCPVLENPCPSGQPLTTLAGEFLLCSASFAHTLIRNCPTGFWCHVGEQRKIAVCCPGDADPCNLPIGQGTGNSAISRFYYDKHFRKCVRFTYSGRGGNANNFETLEDCQNKCPEFINPCAAGDPATASDGSIISCGTEGIQCGDGYYCHRGHTSDNMVCCPKLGDPCQAPRQEGDGEATLSRWFFDAMTLSCAPFTYLGRGGNENNFVTRDECEITCPAFVNPCPNSTLSWPTIPKCDGNVDACPTGQWCHPGHTRTTNVCCPSASLNPCVLALEQGRSSKVGPFTRFFFNSVTDRCEPYQYTGIGGNQNSFYTLEDCQRRCPGQLHASTPCEQPVQPGEGHLFLTRYYFHAGFNQCLPFVFTGNGGNLNNFETLGECVHKCLVAKKIASAEVPFQIRFNSLRSSSSESTQPLVTSTHPTLAPQSGQNELFHEDRLCPQGDPLKTEAGIPISCSIKQQVGCPSAGFVCIQMSSGDAFCCPNPQSFCLQPESSGNCRFGSHPITLNGITQAPISMTLQQRFTYNPVTDSCQAFVYSGCGGNLNNFASRILCSSICCNKGYNHLFKHKLLLLSDSPLESYHNETKLL